MRLWTPVHNKTRIEALAQPSRTEPAVELAVLWILSRSALYDARISAATAQIKNRQGPV